MFRKRIFPLLLVVLFVSIAAGEIQYEIELDEERMEMNTSIQMDCERTCSGVNWRLLDNTQVLSVEDGTGELDYTVEDGTLSIPGRRSFSTDSRTIRIHSMVEKEAEHIYRGLYRQSVSLPSFQGEKTTGFVKTENLISGRTAHGFESSFTGNELRFSGEGPANFRVNFGDGDQTRYYEFFGDKDQDEDEAYRLAVGTVQVVQEFERFPVAVMDRDSYENSVNSWSAGEYVSGSIRVKQGLGEDYLPVLAHETVHGLNDRFMKWDGTSSDYFDEGTASYVEFLMKKKLYSEEKIDIGPRELFGEEKRYRKTGERGTYYRVSSQGDKDELWSYYQNDQEFMKNWNPRDFSETRSFGYAYSHLVIRHYVMNNGSITDIYRSMEDNPRITRPEDKWGFFSNYMDMTPCKYESRERFESCLEDVNSYDYPVQMADPDVERGQLEIERVELPERQESSMRQLEEKGLKLEEFLQGFLIYLGSLIQDLIDEL